MNSVSDADIEKFYVLDKLTMQEVADKLGVSAGYVHKRIHAMGITPRAQMDSPKSIIGKPVSEEHKAKISAAHKGKNVPDKTRALISESRRIKGLGHKKKRCDGYIGLYFPDHPKSSKDGYILEHVLVMESLIGRHLKDEECVHHINGVRDDNRKENLKLMTRREHMSFHMKERHRKRRNGLSTQ